MQRKITVIIRRDKNGRYILLKGKKIRLPPSLSKAKLRQALAKRFAQPKVITRTKRATKPRRRGTRGRQAYGPIRTGLSGIRDEPMFLSRQRRRAVMGTRPESTTEIIKKAQRRFRNPNIVELENKSLEALVAKAKAKTPIRPSGAPARAIPKTERERLEDELLEDIETDMGQTALIDSIKKSERKKAVDDVLAIIDSKKEPEIEVVDITEGKYRTPVRFAIEEDKGEMTLTEPGAVSRKKSVARRVSDTVKKLFTPKTPSARREPIQTRSKTKIPREIDVANIKRSDLMNELRQEFRELAGRNPTVNELLEYAGTEYPGLIETETRMKSRIMNPETFRQGAIGTPAKPKTPARPSTRTPIRPELKTPGDSEGAQASAPSTLKQKLKEREAKAKEAEAIARRLDLEEEGEPPIRRFTAVKAKLKSPDAAVAKQLAEMGDMYETIRNQAIAKMRSEGVSEVQIKKRLRVLDEQLNRGATMTEEELKKQTRERKGKIKVKPLPLEESAEEVEPPPVAKPKSRLFRRAIEVAPVEEDEKALEEAKKKWKGTDTEIKQGEQLFRVEAPKEVIVGQPPEVRELAKQAEEKLTGTGKNNDGGLSNFEIDAIMAPYAKQGKYLGTIPRDMFISKIVPQVRPGKEGGCIINTDPSGKPGSHWQTLYWNPSRAEICFYDSYGDPIEAPLQKDIKALADKLDAKTYLKLKENKIEQQNARSSNCGFFCVKFLIDMFNGKPFKDASGYSDVQNGEKNIERFKTQIGFGYVPSGLQTGFGIQTGGIGLPVISTTWPKPVRELLEKIGNEQIERITIERFPVNKYITAFLNAITLGGWKKAMQKYNYDTMFHLYLIINDKYRLERNEVIMMFPQKENTGNAHITLDLRKFPPTTISEFLNKTEKMYGPKIFRYHPIENNCQVFVKQLLTANGIKFEGSLYEWFTMQDAKSIIEEQPGWLKKLMTTTTDLAHRWYNFIKGRGGQRGGRRAMTEAEGYAYVEANKADNNGRFVYKQLGKPLYHITEDMFMDAVRKGEIKADSSFLDRLKDLGENIINVGKVAVDAIPAVVSGDPSKIIDIGKKAIEAGLKTGSGKKKYR